MNITVVCVSQNHTFTLFPHDITVGLIEIPLRYHNLVDSSQVEKRGSYERVRKVAEMRNRAISEALARFPDTTDILMIDSYYLHQYDAIVRLISNYVNYTYTHVRGGAIWRWAKIGIIRKAQYYDTWAVPNEPSRKLFKPKAKGQRLVDCVGGVYLFPIGLWKLHKYGVPSPLRTEHFEMLKYCNLPIILDREAQFWRTPQDSEVMYLSWSRRIRMTQGRLRRKLLHV